MRDYRIINSQTNTTAQQIHATLNKLMLNQAATEPQIKANTPDILLCVAFIIAGKVMTASVTYGT